MDVANEETRSLRFWICRPALLTLSCCHERRGHVTFFNALPILEVRNYCSRDLALVFRRLSSRGHVTNWTILDGCSAFTRPYLKFQSLSAIRTLASGLPLVQSEEKLMRYWKVLALPTMIAALLSVPRCAAAQVSVNIGPEPVLPVWLLRLRPIQLRPIWVLRARMVQRWRVHRSRPLVPRPPRLPRPC